MPFSHHSHSGQFCPGHAKDSLEEVILTAISRDMDVFATTEHMPRHEEDRYPEEIEPFVTLAAQRANESAYVSEALRLREKYQARINIPIGFEGEWIRPESADLIIESIDTHRYDFFVGSVHHVHTIPIDYDHQMYRDARTKSGGTDEKLFQDYFDAQLAMLQAVKPPVVGHFDLIRLKSDNPNASLSDLAGVWPRILRNLDFIATYGGVLEINSAALRKGLEEPYPQRLICQVGNAHLPFDPGGLFNIPDDLIRRHWREACGSVCLTIVTAKNRSPWSISEYWISLKTPGSSPSPS